MTSTPLETLLQQPPFSLRQDDKDEILLPILRELTEHHIATCPAYKRIIELTAPSFRDARKIEEIPFLPISLFKHRRLRSIPVETIRTTVKSSGTTGMQLSQVDLDADGAKLTSRALSLIIGSVTNNLRLPLLIIDSESALKGEKSLGARASAILGIMPYGRAVTFALNEDFSFNEERVQTFIDTYGDSDFLLFGFTFMIWQHFLPFCAKRKVDFTKGLLLHTGGWKKLQELAVSNQTFKDKLAEESKLNRVINFYGMAEMPGTVLLENTDGLLYPPHFADVIIRDPMTFEPLPYGQKGLIEIVSALPRSYPGHALLTEDIGVIESADSGIGGRMGCGVRILGRAPRAPLRGCSDVLAAQAETAS